MSILLDVMAKRLDGGRGGVRTPQAGAGILLFPFVLEFNGLTVTNRALGLHFYIMHFLCALLPPAKIGQPFDFISRLVHGQGFLEVFDVLSAAGL